MVTFAKLLILAISLSVTSAWAQNFEYGFASDGSAILTRYTGTESVVTIPDKVYSSIPVSALGEGLFSGCTTVTSVIIPSTITTLTSIGDQAFSDCPNLASVELSQKITRIGDYAFAGCPKLETITLPNSVTSIGEGIFFQCTGLKKVTLSNNLNTISDYAFSYCSNLTDITVPFSIFTIGNGAFDHCSKLPSISLPSVSILKSGAFASCTNLTNIVFSQSLTTLGESALMDCSHLTGVNLPSRINTVGSFAFYNCSGLTNIVIPSNLTNLSYAAFALCTNLTGVTLPGSFVALDDYAFYGCTNLAGMPLPASLTAIGESTFAHCKALTNLTIPSAVKTLGDYAFYSCPNITSMTIPGGITNIGYASFASCSNLSSINLSTGLVSISEYAFSDCTSLTSLAIPSTVTRISDTAFFGCTGLTSITIPGKVSSLGSYAFTGCTNLSAINITSDNPLYSSYEGIVYNKAKTVLYQCPTAKTGDYTVPATVKTIAAGAFYGSSLTTITVPKSVTALGDYAFAESPSLANVIFQGLPPALGNSVFEGSYNLLVCYYSSSTGWGPVYGDCPTVCIDVTIPKLAITSPKTGLKASSTAYDLQISGVAFDNLSVASVYVRNNNGNWTLANFGPTLTNWYADVQLSKGMNVLQAYAMDAASNRSATSSVSVTFTPLVPISFSTTGEGKLTPAYTNGQLFVLGSTYSVTATGLKGNVFSNYTGTYCTENNLLKFTADSNTVITANFIANPFNAVAGDYSGLFVNPSIANTNSGAFSASVKTNGTYTGKLVMGTATYPLAGRLQFSVAGYATNTITVGRAIWKVLLRITPEENGVIEGSVLAPTWESPIAAIRNAYSKTNLTPAAGLYTMAVAGETEEDGYGVASLNVGSLGTVSVQGYAADGAAISSSALLSLDNRFPLYAPMTGGGVLIGWGSVSKTNENAVEAEFTWVKPASKAALYPLGFTFTTTNIFGSVYTNSPTLLTYTNAQLVFSGANLSTALTNLVTLSKTTVTDNTKTNVLKVTLTGTSGLFRGSLVNPANKKTSNFAGVLLQNADMGVGAIQGTNQVGQLTLEPRSN